MTSDLQLLRSSATLIAPTKEKPYHQILVANLETGCEICIAATKPYLDPVHVYPWHPEYQEPKPKPEDWISITHSDNCGCSLFSKREADLFDFWQDLHLALRHNRKDRASYALYPEFEYKTGEALAHASLTANLGLRQPIPKCYAPLTQATCRRQLKEALKLVENVTEVSI